MKNVLAALRAVLSDIAALGKQGNAALVGVIAAAAVAIGAKLFGVSLTVAEVSGWVVAVAGFAATIEKLVAIKAAARIRR